MVLTFCKSAPNLRGYKFIGTLANGREWVETEDSTESRPKVKQDDEALHSPFNKIDRGTTFTLRLVGDFIYPKDLSQLVANLPQNSGHQS